MNLKQLNRDPDYIKQHLKELPDGSVVTDTATRILIPVRYEQRHLANLGTETNIVGFFTILMGNTYGVVRTISMLRIVPSSTERVTIDENVYYDFHFEPGDTVFASTDLVMNDTLSYYVYDELVTKGNIPFSFNYDDISKIFDTDIEFAGINLGNPIVVELIVSTIARDPTDYSRLYRHIVNSYDDIKNKPPAITAFRNVIWNTSDTTSRLIGAYFNDAMTASLVNPSERVENIEELLRT